MNYPSGNLGLGTDLALGGLFGVLGARWHQSALGNAATSAFAGLAGNALNAYVFKNWNFLSRETALTTLSLTAASSVSYAVTRAFMHKDPLPKIIFAPSCEDQALKSSWAGRVSQETPSAELSR